MNEEWKRVEQRTRAVALKLWTTPMMFDGQIVLVLDDRLRSIHKGDLVMVCGDSTLPVEIVGDVVKADPEPDGINDEVEFAVEGRYDHDGKRVNICLYRHGEGAFQTENVDLMEKG